MSLLIDDSSMTYKRSSSAKGLFRMVSRNKPGTGEQLGQPDALDSRFGHCVVLRERAGMV